jgi:hypothetical protein
MAKFSDLVNRSNAITSKLGSTGKLRTWATTWAGDGTGRVVVTIEYPSLVSLADSGAKVDASPEFQKWLADARASGIKVLSESLVTELRTQ